LKLLSKDRPIVKKDKEHLGEILKTSLRIVEKIWKHAKEQEIKGKRLIFPIKGRGNVEERGKNLVSKEYLQFL
jgi:hypothetical protein